EIFASPSPLGPGAPTGNERARRCLKRPTVSAVPDHPVPREEAVSLGVSDAGCLSTSQLVLIPSYNTGPRLVETVAAAQQHWRPVWVVIDGSTDGSGESLIKNIKQDTSLRVLRRSENGGKGAAVLDGL